MALTFRDNNGGSPLSFTEMDSNFRYFTGSFENSGSITAASFTSSGNISASGVLYANTTYFPDRIITPLLRNLSSISIYSDSDNITLNGQITASGNISSSAASTASFGTYLGDGSQLTGISGGSTFPFTGDAEITGSLTVSGSSAGIQLESPASSPGSNGIVRLGSKGTTTSNGLEIRTNSGYLQVGPQNASYCHFYTDRGKFYFNASAYFAGNLYSVGQDFVIGRNNGTSDTIRLKDNSIEFDLNSTNMLFISSSHLISGSSISTASFGTYLGDGSQLTGISAGSTFPFTGDAQISGSLLIANQADPEDKYFRAYDQSGDYSIYIDEQRQVSGRAQLYVGANDKGFTDGNPVVSGYNDVSSSMSLYTDRGIYANGSIYGNNITSSGDILTQGMFRGDQLFINSGSSQYLSTPAAGDAALIAISSSGAFSSTGSITPNNLVLFSEYKTGDTGIVNGKAASSILLTVNHGAFSGNNAVAQIACVAQEVGSNYGDLIFSTRGSLNNVSERMRITDSLTAITGSIGVAQPSGSTVISGRVTVTYPVVAWNYNTDSRDLWSDDYIKISWDPTQDFELNILQLGSGGKAVQWSWTKNGTTTEDERTSTGQFDWDTSFGSSTVAVGTIACMEDPTWPFYRVTAHYLDTGNPGVYFFVEKTDFN